MIPRSEANKYANEKGERVEGKCTVKKIAVLQWVL
jgi:hypothetical protein